MTFLPQFIHLVLHISPAGDIARQIANAHTCFNVVNTILFLPFAGKFTQLIKKLMPGDETEINYQPKYLDRNVLNTPAIALELSTKEVARMGDLALENIHKAFEAVDKYDKKKVEFVLDHEPVVDSLEEAITVYLTKMSETNMSKEMSTVHTGLLHACSDIERIGDHAETIAKRVRSMNEDGTHFSQANAEMKELEVLVEGAATKAIKALETHDQELAKASGPVPSGIRQAESHEKEPRRTSEQRHLHSGNWLCDVGIIAEHETGQRPRQKHCPTGHGRVLKNIVRGAAAAAPFLLFIIAGFKPQNCCAD